MPKAKSSTRARSSISGRFITKNQAKAHPKTTEIEKVRSKKKA